VWRRDGGIRRAATRGARDSSSGGNARGRGPSSSHSVLRDATCVAASLRQRWFSTSSRRRGVDAPPNLLRHAGPSTARPGDFFFGGADFVRASSNRARSRRANDLRRLPAHASSACRRGRPLCEFSRCFSVVSAEETSISSFFCAERAEAFLVVFNSGAVRDLLHAVAQGFGAACCKAELVVGAR